MFEFHQVLFLYWKSRIWNLSGRKSLWIMVPCKLLLVLWHCQHTTDGIYILTRPETSQPANYLFSNISPCSVLCSAEQSVSKIFHVIKKTECFPSTGDHRCWRGLVISSAPPRPDTNPVIKCFTFLLTIPHCRQSLSPQLLTKVKGSECLQIETHNSELIITLYSYLESGFWIVIVIMSVLKIQKYFYFSTMLCSVVLL